MIGACAVAVPAGAATITVTSTADSGGGTLREALANANDGDVITLGPGVHQVTSAALLVADAVTIQGAGPAQTVLQADGDNNVVEISGTPGPVTISDLTVTGGGGNNDGQGIELSGIVRVDRVAVVANGTPNTGFNANGGGIDMNTGSNLTVANSLIAANLAYNGAGIDHTGTLLVENSTITGNQAGSFAPGDNGGGGAISGGNATNVTIRASTISGNRGFNDAGTGGISRATVERSIITGNLAFSNSNPALPPLADDCAGAATSLGANIESATTCGFTGPGDVQNTDPLLGTLADNGGPTMTLALLGGSPALDRAGACAGSDQRGVPRPQGAACDSGAFEQATCFGMPTTDVGSDAADEIAATPGNDVIAGFGESDLIRGLDGRDVLCGGAGRDRLLGGAKADRLNGEGDRDRLSGAGGSDRLFGEAGPDSILGGAGRDRLFGGAAKDKLNGGKGRRDRCVGGKGRDRGKRCERGRL